MKVYSRVIEAREGWRGRVLPVYVQRARRKRMEGKPSD